MIPHNRIIATEAHIDAVSRTLRNAHLARGQEIAALENDFCVYTGRKHAVAVASGLDALRLALLWRRDLTPTVPAYSCVALVNAVYSYSDYVGVADCSTDRNKGWTLDKDDLDGEPERAAVVAVNTFGMKADIPKDAAYVIEDATHGFGGRSCQAEVTVLSLGATKLFGAPDSKGGIILTDNKEIADFCRDRRCYDDKEASGTRLNSTMTDKDAALARVTLANIAAIKDERLSIALDYARHLEWAQDNNLLALPPFGDRTWYRFVVHTSRPASLARAALHRRGIMAEKPIEWWPEDRVQNPVAWRAYENNLSLPFFPGITKAEISEVCHAVCEVLK